MDSIKADDKLKKVLVLYTGGTIGMKIEAGFYAPKPNVLIEQLKSISSFYDKEYTKHLLSGIEDDKILAIPNIFAGGSLVYRVEEYNPLLDSSNVASKEWKIIASDIERNYEKYDGFVILHGTDTMCHTASALSFMFDGLKKSVILTGSQIPIFERRNDGVHNFFVSLIYASGLKYPIPEVCIYFATELFRGNRTIKYSCDTMAAFASPNYPRIGSVGIDIRVSIDNVRKYDDVPFRVSYNLIDNVALLQLYPGMPTSLIKLTLRDVQGAVLLTFGNGNIPSARQDVIEALREATCRGVLIVNVTQCMHGIVSEAYEASKELASMGIVPGNDMTTEAALTKLSYVLGLPDLTLEERKRVFKNHFLREHMKMFLTRSEYDRGVNTFSPEGRLFQVEYAIEAIKLGSTAIGICTSEGVVLAVEKRITSSLMESTTIEKIVEVDRHIGCAVSGLMADSRTMIDRARIECQNHWFTYNESMSIESCAQAVSNLAIQFGDSDDDGAAMSRPFGVAILFAGIDEKGPQLYHMDPSGTFVQFDAKAIGSGSEGAQQSLQEMYHHSMTLSEATTSALTILKQVMEEKLNSSNVEVMTMTPENKFHMFDKEQVEEALQLVAPADQAKGDVTSGSSVESKT